ncbi:MAG: ABC transporter ATP-binding protein [Anaerolineaceae bacterium]|nr:ABC transporter ATP-binding protein [Anaerolineaceae bacterium]
MNKIELKNITVRYGKHTVLENFSLNVESGQILGIVGPSGCGKTTVVRAICGFLDPQEGTVSISGNTMFDRSKRINVPPERRNVGVVFQDYAVWPHLTVYENTAYPLKKHGVPKDKIPAQVEEALKLVNMSSYSKYLPSQLSGGQQQRVAIARALTSSSELLIMDEPITNLDAKLREQMLLEIRMMQEKLGTTIVYITHDQEAAMQLCDRIVIMQPDGSIAQIGTDEEIIAKPANRFVFSFVGVSNFLPVKKSGGKLCLDYPEDQTCFSGTIPEDFPKNSDKADMGIRPMDIVFDENSPVRVKINTATFFGNIYNYFIDLAGHEYRVQRITTGNAEDEKYVEGLETGIRFLSCKYFERG